MSKLKAPFDTYYLGTDYYGRDIFSRLLYGARISLIIGIASTVIALVIGSVIGILAGWYGGRLDIVIMQTMDMLLAFPSLILGPDSGRHAWPVYGQYHHRHCADLDPVLSHALPARRPLRSRSANILMRGGRLAFPICA